MPKTRGGHAIITQRDFIRQGSANNWLASEAFDLKSTYSIEAEEILEQVSKILSQENVTIAQAIIIDKKLRTVLNETDPFWMRWRFVAEQKGWLKP